jgi:hypothetical protein
VVFVPGLLVLLAFGVRRRLVLLGASAPASVGVALIVACVVARGGHRFSPSALFSGTCVLAGVGFGVWWLCRWVLRRTRTPRLRLPIRVRSPLPALTGWPRCLAWVLAFGLVGYSAMLTVRVWLAGLGNWTTWNQDHDPILHGLLTAYIMRTGRGAPWQIMPADVLHPTGTVYYPDGFHLLAAAIGDVVGSSNGAVIGMNGAIAMLLGPAWVASASALAGVAAGWLGWRYIPDGLGDGSWTPVGVGAGALVAASLYRPGLELARDNGLLPNASALVLVPGVLAALLAIRAKDWSGAIAVGLACAGVVTVHPSAGLSVGLSILVIWLAMLCGWAGRAALRAQLSALVVVLISAAVIALPVLVGALRVSSRIAAFPPDSPSVPVARTLRKVIPLIYGGMFDHRPMTQTWPTILLLIGIVGTLLLRRAVPLVLAWLMWVVVAVLGYLNPRGVTAPILSFFYNSAGRVQTHIQLFAPALAAVGVLTLIAVVLDTLRRVGALIGGGWRSRALVGRDRLLRRVRGALGRPHARVASPIGLEDAPRSGERTLAVLGLVGLLIFVACYVAVPTGKYLSSNATALTQRWRYPQLFRVDQDDVTAAAWLRTRISPGERIMNSPNDGSSWLYVHDGLPIVELSTLGVPDFPYTWLLMKNFNNLEFDRYVRSEILRLNIAWVYVDSRAPIIGAWGAPDNWTGGGLMTMVPGLIDLEDVRGLTLERVVGSVRIFRVDRAVIEQLQGTQPRGGP